jgi:hypothetical protein
VDSSTQQLSLHCAVLFSYSDTVTRVNIYAKWCELHSHLKVEQRVTVQITEKSLLMSQNSDSLNLYSYFHIHSTMFPSNAITKLQGYASFCMRCFKHTSTAGQHIYILNSTLNSDSPWAGRPGDRMLVGPRFAHLSGLGLRPIHPPVQWGLVVFHEGKVARAWS